MAENNDDQNPNFWEVIKSVLAAMFGVQSDKVRQRDFTKGNPWAFIVVGIVVVILFVLIIYGVVQWVVSQSGISP